MRVLKILQILMQFVNFAPDRIIHIFRSHTIARLTPRILIYFRLFESVRVKYGAIERIILAGRLGSAIEFHQ